MTLKNFLETIEKNECPKDCKFKSKKNIEIAKVPPPKKFLGVIISRDPTVRWWHLYKYFSENEPQEDVKRKILFASAIPILLIYRVLEFMKKPINNKDEKNLFNMIFQNVYWTHLHKCFTNGKKAPFETPNASKCAEKWLKTELTLAINNKTKFIIALGDEVKKQVKKWKKEGGGNKGLKIINLPHPSGRNRKWNNRGDKDIKDAIKELLKQCRED